MTWLVEGEVWHQESVGSRQLVRPGELPLMTAGHGIAHSEQSPPEHSPRLCGAQLWVALPEQAMLYLGRGRGGVGLTAAPRAGRCYWADSRSPRTW